jgi:hypothetical protein
MPIRSRLVFVLVALTTATSAVAEAQTPPPDPAPEAAAGAAAVQLDPDLQIDLVETDFTLSALPTTLRMPARKFSFRLTHRFSRPIAEGGTGDFFADFFGLDSSARVGLEVRYGIRPGTQATVYRTNDRSIQFLGQHQILRQDDTRPVTAHALLAVEGSDNFSEDFSATIGAVVSHRLADRAEVYAQPLMVLNSNPLSDDDAENDHTLLLGLGTRVRIGESRVYVVAEAAPRLAGYDAGVDHVTIAVEKRYGGHVFQFSVSNSLGTTMRQLARGGPEGQDWFVGFNLTRRFF